MRGSEDILEITPQFSTLMQANECSNSSTLSLANECSKSSTLSLDLTPPEITDVRDAVLMEIMTSDDTDRVVELGEIDEGLRRPYNRTMVNAVNLLNRSGKDTEEQVSALIKVVKMQQRVKNG